MNAVLTSQLHQIMKQIYYHHMEANPIRPSPEYLEQHARARDTLIAHLKTQGKRVLLIKADYLEECGRYVCEGDDGGNGYDPLPGTITIEQEV